MKSNSTTESDLLSIIVPIYGVEKYLGRCIESILRQTHQNFELILIDDGSPDRCGAICDEYSAKDSRIKVVHKKNSGVSNSRNVGLRIANGKYITFVDADDTLIDDTTFEVNIAEMENDPELDFIQFPWVSYNSKDLWVKKALENETRTGSKDIYTAIFIDGTMHGYLWGKIFKAKLFENISFRDGYSLGEDALMYLDYINLFHKAKVHNYGCYGYFQRESSGSRTYNATTAKQLCTATVVMYKVGVQFKIENKWLTNFWIKSINECIAPVVYSKGFDTEIRRLIKDLSNNSPKTFDTSLLSDKFKRWLKIIRLTGVYGFIFNYVLLSRIKSKLPSRI